MKKSAFILFYLLFVASLRGQDPQFSQFYAAPLCLGPSMAGVSESPRIIANYRDQWPKLSGRFITYAISYDDFFERYRSGLGLMLLQDRAGSGKLVSNLAAFSYSYRIELSRDLFIQPGISLQYAKQNINFYSLRFADQYYENTVLPSSVETPVEERSGHFDFASSALMYGKRFWIGVSADHLMKLNKNLADNDNYQLFKLSVYGGYKFILKENLINRMEQSVFVASQFRRQGQLQQMDIGVYYKRAPLIVGLWYRGVPFVSPSSSQDALIPLLGLEFGNLLISYSYDFTVSSLITTTGGANEISVAYNFDQLKTKRHRHWRAVPCPKL
jgi:type IX secretion system PorP/SprF family membrane protein